MASKRTYNSTRRSQQAAQTRDDVVAAAIELFRERGWAATTIGAIAEEAGVSVETVYKAGNKAALLRAAYDAAIVGDTAAIPLSDRPEYQRIRAGRTRADRIAAAVAVTADIHQRAAGVWMAVVEAAGGDEVIDTWRQDSERSRRAQVADGVEGVLGEPADEDLLAMIWVLYGADVYLKLTRDEGLPHDEYVAWLERASARILA